MKISDLIILLKEKQKKYGDLQVAIYNEEFAQHDLGICMQIANREEDSDCPFPRNEGLDEIFLSLNLLWNDD